MRRGTICVLIVLALAGESVRGDDGITSISWLTQPTPYYGSAQSASTPIQFIPPFTPSPQSTPGASPSPAPDANPANANPNSPFATSTPGGGFAARSFNETFDGDFSGAFYSKTIVVGYRNENIQTGTQTYRYLVGFSDQGGPVYATGHVPIYTRVNTPITEVVRIPVAGAYSGVLITDNDSPRPMDRTYFGYNYYSGLGTSLNSGVGGINENREMMGFEKTFLDGNASIGVRMPFIQYSGLYQAEGDTVGDLSVLMKYAFYNDRETGNLASAGLVVTTPTSGSGGLLSDGALVPHSVLLQPWLGFVRNFDRAYVQGITDLVIPTDRRDTLLWTNSLATGYWLYRNADSNWLNGIIPTVEFHLHNPLNNRNSAGMIYVPDELNVTSGVHFQLPRATLTGAISVPLLGPRPFNTEVIVNLNFWF
jgi:hypothetical protein